MARDILRIVLAQRLQLVAGRAGQVPRGDLLGDLGTAFAPILRRPRDAGIITVETTRRARTRATIARGAPIGAPETAHLPVTTEWTVTVARRTRVVVATERTVPLPADGTITIAGRSARTLTITTDGTVAVPSGTARTLTIATERTVAVATCGSVAVTWRSARTLTITTDGTVSFSTRTGVLVPVERTIAVTSGSVAARS
ncbi:hypothetical protein [Microbacterium trichothecenolyticum]|uniref:hypothetical protein n=1 Tax=Microbacterium trichothecenolyticum TaxID=69370 RepID=UPI0027D89ABD|nr:hypothetical protein [Microbacterium trichothecenolyticum]